MMFFKDLREFIQILEGEKELLRIKEEVDPRFELSAIAREVEREGGPAVLFEKVKGYDIPVTGNLLGTRKRVNLAIPHEVFTADYDKLVKEVIPPCMVNDGPIKEITIKANIDILEHLPILTYHMRDVSPYITQGVVFLKDMETGKRSMGIHRIQVKGKNRLGIFLASYTSTEIYRKAENKMMPLDVAIAIGVDPTLLLVSVALLPFEDKVGIAGKIKGEPIEFIKCETVDLEVPARSMIVLEGNILPGVREKEGPFGESCGYYITSMNPVIEVTGLNYQKEPIYPFSLPWSSEDRLLWEISQPFFKHLIKKVSPNIGSIRVEVINVGVVIFTIKKREEGNARNALYNILTSNRYIKYAIAVDEDVDIYNNDELAWAFFGRFQWDKDIVLIKDVPGHLLDPSLNEQFLSSKVGFDLTKPLQQQERFEKITVPSDIREKAKEILKRYLG
jgi:2,5-furandicarboxylate decarboxylase 1